MKCPIPGCGKEIKQLSGLQRHLHAHHADKCLSIQAACAILNYPCKYNNDRLVLAASTYYTHYIKRRSERMKRIARLILQNNGFTKEICKYCTKMCEKELSKEQLKRDFRHLYTAKGKITVNLYELTEACRQNEEFREKVTKAIKEGRYKWL